MANFTKKAIVASFIKLLTERPLSQITVKDIVTDCGVNRNTFYYYFEDIPKLIETVVEEDAATIIQTYPTVENFGDCLEAVLDTALSKKRAVLHIYHSTNRDIYEMCLNLERMIEMFSKELAELDKNTVQYMIDEMQDKINAQERTIQSMQEAQKKNLLSLQEEIDRLKQKLKKE